MPRQGQARLAVLGAGPVGLEAALYARKLDYAVGVYERGRVAEFVQRWGHVRMFSPFGMNSTPLGKATILAEKPSHEFPGDADCVTGREHYRKYLEPLAASAPLKGAIATDTQVLRIGRHGFFKSDTTTDAQRERQPFRLLLRDTKGKERIEEADVVLDCTGTYGQHRWLGDGGIPALGELSAETQISYHLDDILGDKLNHYSGKTVLVVGAGYSAATTVCNLAELSLKSPSTFVYWAVRGGGSQPMRRNPSDPLRDRDRLATRANTLATRTDGNVEFHAGAMIETVECFGPDKGFKVTARKAGKTITWNVDRIVANLGYTPDGTLYRELQIAEHFALQGPLKLATVLLARRGEDCLKQLTSGPESLRNPEPNFYILGSKSFGRDTQFLLRLGFEQVREVFAQVTGKGNLDFYKGSR
jgi:thioredoxin reductase